MVDKKRKEKKIEYIPQVCDYLAVFLEDLHGLPLARQIEFQIDLIIGETPMAKSPYMLAQFKMQKLYSQLQELLDKGFIRSNF